MRHEADCWIAACAMAVGASYEDAEGAFGSGADYSDEMLNKSDDPIQRRFRNWIRMLVQADFFTQDGCYPLFLPLENLLLQRERRYLLSGKSPDSLRPWMAHPIVLDESGQVFDPDPAFNLNDPVELSK